MSNKRESVKLKMTSELPWNGKISFDVSLKTPQEFTINFRIPSWTDEPEISINGKKQILNYTKPKTPITGSGFSPKTSVFYPITQKWEKTNNIELNLSSVLNGINKNYKSGTSLEKIRGRFTADAYENFQLLVQKTKPFASEKEYRTYLLTNKSGQFEVKISKE